MLTFSGYHDLARRVDVSKASVCHSRCECVYFLSLRCFRAKCHGLWICLRQLEVSKYQMHVISLIKD